MTQHPTEPALPVVRLSPDKLDAMTPTEIMALPPEAIVSALGGANCDIRTLNIAKKFLEDGVIGKLMPQLIVPGQDGKPASWNSKLDLEVQKDGVEHHELLAALVRASQIAKTEGIALKDVKLDDLKCEDLQDIGAKLTGHAAQQCSIPKGALR